MTKEQKMEFVKAAPDEYLLQQLISFEKRNEYGCFDEDIEIVKCEILRRMARG